MLDHFKLKALFRPVVWEALRSSHCCALLLHFAAFPFISSCSLRGQMDLPTDQIQVFWLSQASQSRESIEWICCIAANVQCLVFIWWCHQRLWVPICVSPRSANFRLRLRALSIIQVLQSCSIFDMLLAPGEVIKHRRGFEIRFGFVWGDLRC